MNARHSLMQAVAAGLLLIAAGTASAQFDYTLTLGVEQNDNVNLSSADPDSQTIVRPSVGFSFDRSGAVVQADVSGTIEHRNYLGGPYSDITRGHLLGTVNWVMIPQRLAWTFADTLSVQPINELQVDAPSNRQQTNVFTTGPTLFFKLGPTVLGQAELRYTNSYAEETQQFNSQRVGAALRAIKDLSSTSAISANLQAQQVQFDEPTVLPAVIVSPDYQRYDAYIGYTRTLAAFDLDLAVGYTQLQFEDGANDDGGPLVRANVGWRPSARSTLSLGLAYQFTDAADAMLRESGMIGELATDIRTGDATISSQAFLERRADFGYQYESVRWGFSVSPYYRELEYTINPALDRTGTGVRTRLSWALRPRLQLSFHAAGEQLDYATINNQIERRSYGAALGYQMTERLSWHLNLSHFQRDSSLTGLNVEQNIAYVWVAWSR